MRRFLVLALVAAPITLPGQLSFKADGTGATTRSIAKKLGDIVSVKDFGAVGDGVADDTPAITNAIGTGRAVYFPTGTYKITSTITGQGAWIGDGQGPTYSSTLDSHTTIILCSGTNSGNAFVVPPQDMQGIHFDGVTSDNQGLQLGVNASFVAFYRWRNITVRRFSTGIHVYNLYSTDWQNIVVQGNVEGIRIDPTDSVADDGYFTSFSWRNVHIADNTSFGLYAFPAASTSKTWTWENVVIERNAASGSYQAFLQNIVLEARGFYAEGTSGVPALQTNNVNIEMYNAYFNGTGGINATSNTFRAFFYRVEMTTASDTITGLSSASHMTVRDSSTLQTDPRSTIGGRADVQQSTVGGVFVSRQTTTVFTSPTYGATVTIDAKLGNIFLITATNGTAFTVSNPTSGTQGQTLTVCISNTSGGALGAVTWGANYKLSAFTNPATGFQRCVSFVSSSATNWIQTYQSAADIPN